MFVYWVLPSFERTFTGFYRVVPSFFSTLPAFRFSHGFYTLLGFTEFCTSNPVRCCSSGTRPDNQSDLLTGLSFPRHRIGRRRRRARRRLASRGHRRQPGGRLRRQPLRPRRRPQRRLVQHEVRPGHAPLFFLIGRHQRDGFAAGFLFDIFAFLPS